MCQKKPSKNHNQNKWIAIILGGRHTRPLFFLLHAYQVPSPAWNKPLASIWCTPRATWTVSWNEWNIYCAGVCVCVAVCLFIWFICWAPPYPCTTVVGAFVHFFGEVLFDFRSLGKKVSFFTSTSHRGAASTIKRDSGSKKKHPSRWQRPSGPAVQTFWASTRRRRRWLAPVVLFVVGWVLSSAARQVPFPCALVHLLRVCRRELWHGCWLLVAGRATIS